MLPNKDIKVSVETQYLEDQSDSSEDRYVFVYTVTIENRGDISAQLISRHWIITDSNQKVQEVKGEGVVGEQPYLHPGTRFSYTSGTVLETPLGTMRGSYQMIAEDGSEFEAEIKEFLLSAPRTIH